MTRRPDGASARGKAAKNRRRRGWAKRRPGALSILAILLVLSGATRFVETSLGAQEEGWSALAAWAQEAREATPPERPPEPETSDVLVASLTEREKRLASRERAMEEREHALELARKELDQSLIALETAEASLREMVALADGAAQADLDRLTRVYETMKPKDAAALFETMDPTFAAGFLGQMNPAIAAEVLAGLPPETAYGISLILAGRNVGAVAE